MFTETVYEIHSNERVAKGTHRMELRGDTRGITAPGQFIHIRLPGFYLRRPISVCDYDGQGLSIIYKVVGEGTRFMSGLKRGAKLDALCGLGNGFDTALCGQKPLLVGGGAGVPPLYGLAKALRAQNRPVRAVLGFNTQADVFLEQAFLELGVGTQIATLDASCGVAGSVCDAMKLAAPYDYVFACGPEPMLKAVYDMSEADGQYSFETRMACGFGACMGCSCKTKYGSKRICTDGPVLLREEIVW
ncbi:MAG: dihydroorotate dehydrogenase electron transfer subunit [Christensenellales bacterium]|jgi:dihydroorotate dehydrogenase electron transfer subunit